MRELKKSLDDKERAAKAAVTTTVVKTAQSIIESKVGCQVLVEVLEAYNNTKALDLALKKIKAISPETSALLISVDRDVKKIFALSSASKVRTFSLERRFYLTIKVKTIIFISRTNLFTVRDIQRAEGK